MEISSGVILVCLLAAWALWKAATDAADAAAEFTPNTQTGVVAEPKPLLVVSGRVEDVIRAAAVQFGEDAALMLAIAKKESSFNAAAVNPSDPSYGLFQIQVFWLKHFGFPADKNSLLDPVRASEVAARILHYFRNRQNPLTGDWFKFPADVDVYNVGETLWAQGRRNIGYRDQVTKFYREFGGKS